MAKDEDGAGGDDETNYFLEPQMQWKRQDGSFIRLDDLERELTGASEWARGWPNLWDPKAASRSGGRVKAKVTPGQGLLLWDGESEVKYRWKHLGPQPDVLVPLLKTLVNVASATAPAMVAAATAAATATTITPAGALLLGSLTQDGVARAFGDHFSEQMQYCHDTGRWYNWTGVYWQPKHTKLAFQYCRELARTSRTARGRRELKEVRRVTFASGVEKFAQSDRRIATRADQWDRDIYLLGTPSGTLDLRTGVCCGPSIQPTGSLD